MVDASVDIGGTVWKVLVDVGDRVDERSILAVVETMKMEIPVQAPVSGRVVDVLVEEGQLVREDQLIAVIA